MAKLRQFEVRVVDDKLDPELFCLECGVTVCDVEHGDPLSALVRTVRDHVCPPPKPPEPWDHEGHVEVQHRDGKPPHCSECGWAAPVPARPAVKWGKVRG